MTSPAPPDSARVRTQDWRWHKSGGQRGEQKTEHLSRAESWSTSPLWARHRETEGFKNRTAPLLQAGKQHRLKPTFLILSSWSPLNRGPPEPQRGNWTGVGLHNWTMGLELCPEWSNCSLPLKRDPRPWNTRSLVADSSFQRRAIGQAVSGTDQNICIQAQLVVSKQFLEDATPLRRGSQGYKVENGRVGVLWGGLGSGGG